MLTVSHAPPAPPLRTFGAIPPVVVFLMNAEHTAINGTFALASRLTSEGYRPVYVVEERFVEHVRRQGFEVRVLNLWWQHNQLATAQRASRLGSVPGWRRWALSFRFELDYYRQAMVRLGQWLDEVRPSLVLLDPLIWPVSPPMLARSIPVMGFSATLAGRIDAGIPPVFCRMVPGRTGGGLERVRHAVAWARLVLANLAYTARHAMRLICLAEVLRLGARVRCSEYGFTLDTFELVASPARFDFPSAARRQRLYLGDCVGPSRDDGPFDDGWIRSDRPLVYCSLGTYSRAYAHRGRLYAALIEAMRNQDEWQAIIQVGPDARLDAFGEPPPGVRVTHWVPQLEVLARAGVFITQGGLGSIREAIHFGVPMLVLPCWYDQPGNAARVEYHGLGIVAEMSTIDAAALRRALRELLAPERRRHVERMNAAIAAEDECGMAVSGIAGRIGATA